MVLKLHKRAEEHFYEHLSKCELNEILIFRNMQLLISVPILQGGGVMHHLSSESSRCLEDDKRKKACCGLPSNPSSANLQW